MWSFSANTPLVGPYSRFGWNHPGPIVYYLLAPFSGLFGQPAWATLVGAALLQGVAIVWIARLSWKTGGLRWLIPWIAVVVLSYGATGPWILQQPWNPHIAFPFFALLLLQCWLVGMGQTRRLIGLAFVASFLVQTHIGYALLVLILVLWAVGRLALAKRGEEHRLTDPAVWRAPLVVLVVVWFVPLVLDPIMHFPGNTARLVKFYLGFGTHQHQQLLRLHHGAGYLAAEFRWPPPWLGGPDPLDPFTGLASPRSSFRIEGRSLAPT